jgi:Rrf2 family protein
MKITRRTDYAIHLISDLSAQPNCCLGLRTLAEDHGVTYAFARTVQQGLLKAGIIKASRGINGGIKLAKPLEEISLLEVFEAAQNPLDDAFDTSDSPWCSCEGKTCITDDLWKSTKENLSSHLASISMASLLN